MSPHAVAQIVFDNISNSAQRFERNRMVQAVREGLINLIPLVLAGAVCLAISSLPIPGWHDFLNAITFGHWTALSSILVFATLDILGLATLLSVSYSVAAQSTSLKKHDVSTFIPMFTAFACYLILVVWDTAIYGPVALDQDPAITFISPGKGGAFAALFVALAAPNLFIALSKFWQRAPWVSRHTLGSDYMLRIALRAVVPVVGTLICFIFLRLLLDELFVSATFMLLVEDLITSLVSRGDLPSLIALVLIVQVLRFIGAHGLMAIDPYLSRAEPSAITGALQEGGAVISNQVPAATELVPTSSLFTNSEFFRTFLDLGGAGAAMALLLALAIFGSQGRGRRMARISVFPVAFNINETLLFGVPVVLNPFFLIPFILAPVITAAVAWAAFNWGIVPPVINSVDWTTPILFSGFLSTGSLWGSALQLVCVGLCFVLYAPFVLIAKHATERHHREIFLTFKKEASEAASNEQVSLIGRHDDIGEMARDFASELTNCFHKGRIPFRMVYQPKTNAKGEVVGAEALLRGDHPNYGPVPPDALIEITDEAGLSVEVGRWITTQGLEEYARWHEIGVTQLVLSINLNPRHIFIDREYAAFLEGEMERLHIDPAHIELEITEHVAVKQSEEMLTLFYALRNLGVGLSIDDMGMGYSSLSYISDFGVQTVKIDISLINSVACDTQQQEIVHSILELARQINLAVVVEGVEEQEQVDALVNLGCRYFQGYHFSKPLPPIEFLAYVFEHGVAQLEHEGRKADEGADSSAEKEVGSSAV